MTALSNRERRLVAIAILLGLVAVVWLGLISPILSGFAERSAERERLRGEFARNERLVAGIAPLRREIERQTLAKDDFHTPGDTVVAATEALKERLGVLVTAQGGEMRAVQDVSNRPGWAQVWIEARLTLPQLVGIMTKVQSQPPYLAVNALNISADRALQSGTLDLMDVRIEVSSPIIPTKPR
jgi:type II secretory pathway component PulM